MSRTERSKTYRYPRWPDRRDRGGLIPAWYKRSVRKAKRHSNNRAIERGDDPEPDRNNYRNFL